MDGGKKSMSDLMRELDALGDAKTPIKDPSAFEERMKFYRAHPELVEMQNAFRAGQRGDEEAYSTFLHYLDMDRKDRPPNIERTFELMCRQALEDGIMSQVECDRIKDAVASGSTTKQQVVRDWTSKVMMASSLKTAEAVRASTGSDRPTAILQNQYALSEACGYGNDDRAEIHIAAGADVNWRSPSKLGEPGGRFARPGATPLHEASANKHPSTIRLLLSHGAKSDHVTDDGWQPLHMVCELGRERKGKEEDHALECIRLLLDANANIDAQTDLGFTPLNIACKTAFDGDVSGPERLVALLIAAGASLDLPSSFKPDSGASKLLDDGLYENTPLMSTCENDYAECARLLLAAGAAVNLKSSQGQTALSYAAKQGAVGCVDVLLAKNAMIDLADDTGHTPLYMAAEFGRTECVTRLLAANANPRLTNENGTSPLFIASQSGNALTMRILLDAGAPVDQARAKTGATPLFISCRYGHMACAELLIRSGADVDHVTHKKISPIAIACEYGHLECVKLLSSCGAERTTADVHGAGHCSYFATQFGHMAVARWLRRSNDWTQLHHIEQLDVERTRALLRDGADIRQTACCVFESQPGPVSPLEMARRLTAGSNSSSKAAALIVQAGKPWSQATHELFPASARVLALHLLLVGELLERQHPAFDRGTTEGHTFSKDVWQQNVMPQVISRSLCWSLGCPVRICGIKARPALNGIVGELCVNEHERANGGGARWGVRVDGKELALRRENLRCCCARCLSL